MTGPIAATIKVNSQLIKNIHISAPIDTATDLIANEIDEPITVSIKVVSVVSLDNTSPV